MPELALPSCRSAWKWPKGRRIESPDGLPVMFACRQIAINRFVPNNFAGAKWKGDGIILSRLLICSSSIRKIERKAE